MKKRLSLGISPCPNDTYIFHALLEGLSAAPCEIDLHMADVEELNALAMQGRLDITKLSAGVLPQVIDRYAVLHAGAALGWGCGPLVVARRPLTAEECRCARVASPGHLTTAHLLLSLHGGFQGPREEMLFSDVMPAVATGRVDCGIIIHEGRFTYAQHGLVQLLDTGAWWEERFGVPLPLGAIAVRRDLDRGLARAVDQAIADSLRYANAHPDASREFIRRHAQEMDPEVTARHIATFVTAYSLDLGEQGRQALEVLVRCAAQEEGRAVPETGLFL